MQSAEAQPIGYGDGERSTIGSCFQLDIMDHRGIHVPVSRMPFLLYKMCRNEV
jgi:hypothetical protein